MTRGPPPPRGATGGIGGGADRPMSRGAERTMSRGAMGMSPPRERERDRDRDRDRERDRERESARERPVPMSRPMGLSAGLSSRSRGFRPTKVTNEQVRPTALPLSFSFGKGARKYVPPAVRHLAMAESTMQRPGPATQAPAADDAKRADNEASPKAAASAASNNKAAPPQRRAKPTAPRNASPATQRKAEPASPVKPRKIATPPRRQNNNDISPAKSTRSNASSSSARSSRSSQSSKSARNKRTFNLSGQSQKYLALRKNTRSLSDVAIISRDNKKVHDFSSIKDELGKKIAANDDTAASNEYYFNKNDMVDVVGQTQFSSNIEVTDNQKKIKSNAEEYYPAAKAAYNAPLSATPSDVYAQDGLPSTAVNPQMSANPVTASVNVNVSAVPVSVTGTAWQSNATPTGTTAAYNPYASPTNPMQPTHGPGLSSAYDNSQSGSPGLDNMDHSGVATQAQFQPMLPTHTPGQAGADATFAGMIPHVPVITDPSEIQKNAAIAMESNLSPTVNEFVPVQGSTAPGQMQALNQHFQFGQMGQFQPVQAPMNQMNANMILQQQMGANLQNQQWLNQQQAPPQQQQPGGAGAGGVDESAASGQVVGFQPHSTQQQGGGNRDNNSNYNQQNRGYGNNRRYNNQRGGYQRGSRGRLRYQGNMNNNNYNSNPNRNQYNRPNRNESNNMMDNSNQNMGNDRNEQQSGMQGGNQYNSSQQGGNQYNNGNRGYNPRSRGGRGGSYNNNRRYNNNQYNNYNNNNSNAQNQMSDAAQSQNQNQMNNAPQSQQQQPPQQQQQRNYNQQQQTQQPNRYNTNSYTTNNSRYSRRYGGQSRHQRRQQRELTENQNRLYKKHIFSAEQQAQKSYNKDLLPSWCGTNNIAELFSGEDGETELLDSGLYLKYLCDAASDGVFECLGFKEIVQSLVPACNKALKQRIYESAPVFSSLCIDDWHLELGGGFVRHIGNGDVLKKEGGLFQYKNPYGLKEFSIKYSKSLNDWLAAVPWNELKDYLQNARQLTTVVIGDGKTWNQRELNDHHRDEAISTLSKADVEKMDLLVGLFSALVKCETFIVESAPFAIDSNFILSLSSMVSDLRLYDAKIMWNEAFLQSIARHFGNLERFGFPANCIDMPTLVNIIETLAEELVIKNVSNINRCKIQRQDLAMLFLRFARIEIDSSLIAQYPSTKNKTAIKILSVQSDTHNFFIPLLMAIPSSVRHLIIKNPTYSTNNLHFDAQQQQQNKYNTKNVQQLTLEGFDNNLKQISRVLNSALFPNLRRLNIVTRSADRKLTDIERDIHALYKFDVDEKGLELKAFYQARHY